MKVEYTEDFIEWYNNYPRKVAKIDAFKAWQKQIGDSADLFNDVAKVAIEDVKKRVRMKWFHPDKSKIPHPATFINQRRWEDEDWQDDVKTRGKEHDAAGSTYTPRTYIEDAYECDGWQAMLNRVMRSNLLACGGVTDAMLEKMIKIKSTVHSQNIDAVREEIEIREDKREAKAEMGFLLADQMLAQFDSATGYMKRSTILAGAKT